MAVWQALRIWLSSVFCLLSSDKVTFFFLLLFMIFVFWRPQDWLWTWMIGWNILDVVVVGAILSFIAERGFGKSTNSAKKPQLFLLLGLFVSVMISHVAHTYLAGMIDSAVDVSKICIVTAIFFIVLDRPSRLRTVIWLWVIMACIMTIHALMQARTGSGFAGALPLHIPKFGEEEAHFRSLFFGIFADPNDLAQMLATSIPLCFLLFKRKSFLGFLLGCALAWFLVEGILVTHSRSGLIALAAVSAIMVALILPSRWIPYVMIVIFLSALILCPLSAGYLDESARDRVVFWGYANRMFKSNLLFGIGYGMFWMVAEDRAAHNAFVSCYTELGFLGYWFWFGLLQLSFIGAWRTRIVLGRPDTTDQAWLRRCAGLTIAAIVGYCASAYFLSRAFVYPLFFLFAMAGSLPLIARDILPEDIQFEPYLLRKHVLIWGSIGAVVSIVYIYSSIILLNRAWGG